MQRVKIVTSIAYPIAIVYIIGAIPFSYILGKIAKNIDIRQMGSHNAGATNLMRCVGKPLGITALTLDVLKGVLAVSIIANFFYSQAMIMNPYLFRVVLGLTVVAGHVWTVFLKFKGGKGVATTIGVLIGLSPLAAIAGLLVWCLFALIYKYVSLSSMVMSASLPIFMFVFGQPREYVILSTILCVIIIYRHRSNIYRLIKGKEYKIGQKASG
ncbi:MAG: glycerol-3-phosphate 1-O-acyltransferase [Dehalococcoidia bacterium]|nr:MAG: glycerol-3-phosphate 1-O-acyltransferase [Dehalococcoidia bacterium]